MKKILLMAMLALLSASAVAQQLKQRLDSLFCDPLLETSQMGVMIWDLEADTMVYGREQRQLMRPASTMKVLTAVTAIDVLGSDYTLSTSLYLHGEIIGRTLVGDLYCVGGMDPMFDTDDMEALVANVRRLGIDTLCGRIVADTSVKDTLRWGEGWCWDDDNYDLTPLRMGRRLDFAEQMAVWMTRGGVVLPDGACTATGRLPGNATFVCARTHTLDQVLREMMKESNNLYAESVFYQLAIKTGHRPATAKEARKQVRDAMLRAGLLPQQWLVALQLRLGRGSHHDAALCLVR